MPSNDTWCTDKEKKSIFPAFFYHHWLSQDELLIYVIKARQLWYGQTDAQTGQVNLKIFTARDSKSHENLNAVFD